MRAFIVGVVATGLVFGALGACGTSNPSNQGNAQNGAGSGGSSSSDGAGGIVNDGSGSGGSAPDGGGASPDGSRGDSGGTIGDGSFGTDGNAPHDAAGQSDGPASRDGGDSGVAPYKGIGANSECADMSRLGVTWYYGWDLSPPCTPGPPFVPMVWGHSGTEQTQAGITGEVSSLVSDGYDYVLGFNEPDNTGQSDIPDAATAISLWPAFNNPAVLVGSPATQGNGTGLTWIQNFMSAVNADTTGTLRVDFIATHWYGWNSGSCDANAANLESWLNGIEAIPGNRPIWLTEWGCLNQSNPSEAVVQAFFSGAIAMFARHPRLQRYAWYQWTTNNELINPDGGAITSIGTAFAAAPGYP